MSYTKKILVLGTGPVASPCIEFLSRDVKNSITVASRTLQHAQNLAAQFLRTTATSVDVTTKDLDVMVSTHDVVISLIPPSLHPVVMRSAIKAHTNVITTSHLRAEVRELELQALEAGVTIISEVGVAPGFDHLHAVDMIEQITKEDGRVEEFRSFCGSMPAPECSHNPLRFKFTWSPRGTLLSQAYEASYLENGKEITIEAENLMRTAKPCTILPGYDLLSYPSRDSVSFRDLYQIPKANTVIRGSLRYRGNPEMISALQELGWLDTVEQHWLLPEATFTWAQLHQKVLGATDATEACLISKIEEVLHRDPTEVRGIVDGIRSLGLLSQEPVNPVRDNILDIFCDRLESQLRYKPRERDVVLLQHQFEVSWSDGRRETRKRTLELFGNATEQSALAFSTGLVCAATCKLLLAGNPAFCTPGFVLPLTKEVCDPIRQIVTEEGLVMTEEIVAH